MPIIRRTNLVGVDFSYIIHILSQAGVKDTIQVIPVIENGQEVALNVEVSDADETTAISALDSITNFPARNTWVEPLPVLISQHTQHLRDYLTADPATITNAQTVHVLRDLIRVVYFLNRRIEKE